MPKTVKVLIKAAELLGISDPYTAVQYNVGIR